MHIAQNYGPPLLPANPFSSPDPWTANLSTCSPFIVAPQADMCPNNPWGTVSLPVFENQWVPHPQSRLINVMPGLQHCSDIHREFAIYMPRWFHPELGTELLCGGLFLFPIQRGALRRLLYGHSRHWFACGFKPKICFHISDCSHFQHFIPIGFPSSPEAVVQCLPSDQDTPFLQEVSPD